MTRARYHRQPTPVKLTDELEARLEAAVERERERLRALGVDEAAVGQVATRSAVIRRLLDEALALDEARDGAAEAPVERRPRIGITA